jgi:phosphoribosyl-ATP pyrophosphohydrolase/phosphoribosyl-AMP cyclohydrolase
MKLLETLDFDKGGGLIPAVVQDADSSELLMLAYMNREAVQATLKSRRVTFFSRSRQQLWIKGETSGNFLELVAIEADCDQDTLLVLARPAGPVCHRGTRTCFGDSKMPVPGFLGHLDHLVAERHRQRPAGSYTTELFESGIHRMAQKVGEEAVETALAATLADDSIVDESADLLYHLLVLLRARGFGLQELVARLAVRHAG